MSVQAFDLAERYQTPVFVLSDLDIGMNDWMVPKLTWDDSYRPDRGKVLIGGGARGGEVVRPLRRRRWRRHPVPHAARGPSQGRVLYRADPATTATRAYTEDGDEYVDVLDRIDRKIQRAARSVPAPIVRTTPGAKLGILTIGGCHAACSEALDILGREGIAVDYMRVRGFPFSDDVRAFLDAHEVTFVVEQNRDAQLRSMLLLETGVAPEKMESVRYYGGFPMSAHHVISGVKARLEKAA